MFQSWGPPPQWQAWGGGGWGHSPTGLGFQALQEVAARAIAGQQGEKEKKGEE